MEKIGNKVLLALIMITSFLLIWQSYQIFFTKHTAIAATRSNNTSLNKPLVNNVGDGISKMENRIMDSEQTDSGFGPISSRQKRYLKMVSEYQIVQMERLVAEEKASIAIARRNAAKAAIEEMHYQVGMVNQPASVKTPFGTVRPTIWRVKSIQARYDGSSSASAWIAVLENNGKILKVHPGDILTNGAKVISINKSGVVLKKGNYSQKLLLTHHAENKSSHN